MKQPPGVARCNRPLVKAPAIGRLRRVVFHPELPQELRELFRNPEALVPELSIVKNSRSTTAGIFVVSGVPYFWKRSNVSTFAERFRRVARLSRAEINRRAAKRLESLGVRTPKVWMSASTFSVYGLPGASYLITEGFPPPITAAENLAALIADAGSVEKLAGRLMKMVFSLHEAGFEHGDLKLVNFLALPGKTGGWELGLFDLDGAHLHRKCCSHNVRVKEVARTASSMYIELKERQIASGYDSLESVGRLFAECYQKAGGGNYAGEPLFERRLERGWAHRASARNRSL